MTIFEFVFLLKKIDTQDFDLFLCFSTECLNIETKKPVYCTCLCYESAEHFFSPSLQPVFVKYGEVVRFFTKNIFFDVQFLRVVFRAQARLRFNSTFCFWSTKSESSWKISSTFLLSKFIKNQRVEETQCSFLKFLKFLEFSDFFLKISNFFFLNFFY